MTPIHHTFGPHVDRAYMLQTLLVSYKPWAYVRGSAVNGLKQDLKTMFGTEPFLFASGREALLALMRAIGLRAGEEVIVQGYTCVVVPNAIHAAGGTVTYADIDPDTLNLTPDTVRPLITPRTRAIICQHTFGIPADTKALRRLCDEHKIFLIEDMAHALPDTKGPHIGKDGDFLILSFGRDKAVSGISGGAVLSRRERESRQLLEIERTAGHVRWTEVMKLLEYPSRMRSVVRPLAGTIFLKPAVKLMNMLGFFVPVVTADEKKGRMNPVVRKMPNACAALTRYSLRRLKAINERRRLLAAFFARQAQTRGWPALRGAAADLPLQKFPMFVPSAEEIRKTLRKDNMHLDDGWTGCVICPDDVSLSDAGYQWGSDPKAEEASRQILSLPTHPTMTLIEAERLTRRLNELLK